MPDNCDFSSEEPVAVVIRVWNSHADAVTARVALMQAMESAEKISMDQERVLEKLESSNGTWQVTLRGAEIATLRFRD